MRGTPWVEARPSAVARVEVARDLGRAVARVHRLTADGVARHEDWLTLDVTAAAARSSLPAHLLPQIEDFLARFDSSDRVLVHGDLMDRHVFVDDGRLAGIIDWGDAIETDRHYELAKLHLDLFGGDKALLRAFVTAARWPVPPDFAARALAFALYRQAHGLAQHDRMDVFHKLPSLVDENHVASLDELADALFEL
jgi:Ser/Thr protein kinase RdoA (MazF antagonist)